MGKKSQQTQAASSDPPAEMRESYRIARVETINGNNIYTVTLPPAHTTPAPIGTVYDVPPPHTSTTECGTMSVLVELPPKFRNTMWIRRHGFVMVDVVAFAGRVNKLSGEIVCVIHDEKRWRKMPYWPAQFRGSKLGGKSDGGAGAGGTGPEGGGSAGHDDGDGGAMESDDGDGSLNGNFNRRRNDSSDDESG